MFVCTNQLFLTVNQAKGSAVIAGNDADCI
jgi:hypothetical protein